MSRLHDSLMQLTRGSRQSPTASAGSGNHSLNRGVIVIATHSGVGVLSDPVDAGNRVCTVFHQITQKETGIKRFLYGR